MLRREPNPLLASFAIQEEGQISHPAAADQTSAGAPLGGSGERAITDAMSESMEQFILSVFERNEPYSTLFDSRRAFINGPLSFFYQNWLDIAAGIAYRPLAINPDQTPTA